MWEKLVSPMTQHRTTWMKAWVDLYCNLFFRFLFLSHRPLAYCPCFRVPFPAPFAHSVSAPPFVSSISSFFLFRLKPSICSVHFIRFTCLVSTQSSVSFVSSLDRSLHLHPFHSFRPFRLWSVSSLVRFASGPFRLHPFTSLWSHDLSTWMPVHLPLGFFPTRNLTIWLSFFSQLTRHPFTSFFPFPCFHPLSSTIFLS